MIFSKVHILYIIILLFIILFTENSYAVKKCTYYHGPLTCFNDSASGYVSYRHNNDAPFTEGVPLVHQLDPDVIIDPNEFIVASYTSTNFAGSLSTPQTNADSIMDSNNIAINLSTLDLSSFPTSKEVIFPDSVGSGIEKHTIVVQRWVVNRDWRSVHWEDTRDYVLENYEYRVADSSDNTFDAISEGVIKDVNGKEFKITIETRVQEDGVSKNLCKEVCPGYRSWGYGVHIYPVFIIKADYLDEETEISELHNPKLASGYTGEIVLYRKPR